MQETVRKSVTGVPNDNVKLLDSNELRAGACLYNNTNKTIYVAFGDKRASVNDFTNQIYSGSFYEIPKTFVDSVQAFCPSGISGTIMVTEW